MSAEQHYLVETARQALALDPRVMELGLQISIVDDKVFVTGTVSTAERRDAIAAVLADVAPDLVVHNQTVVASDNETEEVEQI